MIDNQSWARADSLRTVAHYPTSTLAYGLIAVVLGLMLVLFVFTNWKENHADSAVDAATWVTLGNYAFRAWAISWLVSILVSALHAYRVHRRGGDESKRRVLRLLYGFVFFPPFIAVIGYLPVYALIGAIADVLV